MRKPNKDPSYYTPYANCFGKHVRQYLLGTTYPILTIAYSGMETALGKGHPRDIDVLADLRYTTLMFPILNKSQMKLNKMSICLFLADVRGFSI